MICRQALTRLARTGFRNYSEAAPLYKIHEPLKDVEQLFEKYNLNKLMKPEQIQELVRSGTISEHIGSQLLHDLKVQQEAGKTAEYWRKVFLFIGLPIIGIIGVNTYLIEKEHFVHLEHHPVNQVPYDHLKFRGKKFPWGDGDQTLFHNEKVNR